MKEITINVIDESGKKHKIVTPLEMGLNLMDVLRSHDLVEGACLSLIHISEHTRPY